LVEGRNTHKVGLTEKGLKMRLIGVATADSRAYYLILSRLKKTNLCFVSLTPAKAIEEGFRPVITTKRETGDLGLGSIAVEELDDDPLIMEGQILSHGLRQAKQVLLIGVDPGSRIGVAVFYGGVKLGSLTFNSVELLCRRIVDVVQGIPHDRALIRIGDGSPRQSRLIVEMIATRLPRAIIEIVDEKGTSTRHLKGLTSDQVAAQRIAIRKGSVMKLRRR
jgi:hypothetical protein